jgi:hypothetical protein
LVNFTPTTLLTIRQGPTHGHLAFQQPGLFTGLYDLPTRLSRTNH